VEAVLGGLVDRVTRRMRAARRVGRTVLLRLRFDDLSRASRSRTLLFPTAHTATVLATERELLAAAWPMIRQRGLTLVGVAVGNLDGGDATQPPLPFERHAGAELDLAVDAVRDRFGSAALTRAALLGRDPGLSVPLLPD
jgi:DNA polymerase-4